jgi:hypothetical protein
MIKYQSPKGIAHFPALIRPDTRYNAEGTYKTGLIVSPESIEDLIEQCKEAFTDEFGKKKKLSEAQMPYKAHTVKNEKTEEYEETGDMVVSFSSKKPPKFFDAKGNAITKLSVISKLGGGSKLRLKGAIGAYNAGGKVGVKIYLNEVQVITYVEYNGGGFQADDEEDDGFDVNAAGGNDSDAGDERPEAPPEDIDF